MVSKGFKAVVFDVFGTLVRISEPRRPYRKLVQMLAAAGRMPLPTDGALIMGSELDLARAAVLLAGSLPPPDVSELELELKAEMASIVLYPEVREVLLALREQGYKIGLCSNLALPYGPPVLDLLPFEPDFSAWSYRAGAVKPEEGIYRYLCEGLQCLPAEVLMVGDTLEADRAGPRRYGIAGYHLLRGQQTGDSETLSSLRDVFRFL